MRPNSPLGRGAALEEIYVRQLEHERQRRRESRLEREELRAELGLCGFRLVDRLLQLGITANTAPAFEALPLIEVAWADGSVDSEERWLVLRGATAFGLELGRPAHAQVELWLARRPSPELFEAWLAFAGQVLGAPDATHRAHRALEGARRVARAAGGFLGFGAVARSESGVLDRIAHAITPMRANVPN